MAISSELVIVLVEWIQKVIICSANINYGAILHWFYVFFYEQMWFCEYKLWECVWKVFTLYFDR